MTSDFEKAVRRVIHDIKLDGGSAADLVAVGVKRDDCLKLLGDLIEDERITAEVLAVIVQMCVCIGVWLERGRWMTS